MANSPLIYGQEYDLWRNGLYIGQAIWTNDKNLGDVFLRKVLNDESELINEVCTADQWVFPTGIIKEHYSN